MRLKIAPKVGIRILIALFAIFAIAGSTLLSNVFVSAAPPPPGGQASITLTNCDAQYCYTHNNIWTLTKTAAPNISQGVGSVTWTITATKDTTAAPTFAVKGGVTVTNTGTAPATIGNIVVNLQKPNSPKLGSNAPYVSIAADVADATNGDAATSANIVAAGSQENVATNAAWGTNNYTTFGAKGTFTETAGKSGSLEFTDASNNTVFSLVPQPTIPVGGSVTLLYSASFSTSILTAGTSYRVETMVTFGNSGARGGSGATGDNIDINGNGSLDSDEAHVRTVPCRVTLAALPSAPSECNSSVTVTDTGATTSGTVVASNPQFFDQFPATISDSTTFIPVSVDVDSGTQGGEVCNAADLNGAACGGTLGVVVGYTPDQFVDITPDDGINNPVNIGHQPIYATYECAPAASAHKEACVEVSPPEGGCTNCPPNVCTYTKGKFQSNANNPVANYVQSNFSTLFPTGLTIGIADGAGPRHNATWTDVNALRTWISGGGTSEALTADTSNATSTSGGNLAKQTAALTLNLALSGSSNGQPAGLGGLYICGTGTSADGKTISQILAQANAFLGGDSANYTLGLSASDLNNLIDSLNNSFDDCAAGSFAPHLQTTPCQ